MIGFSPRGVIDITIIFPVMFVIALALDIIGLLSIVGGTVLDIIGFLTIGLWIIFRSGGERRTDIKQSQTTEKEGAETATKTTVREGAEVATKEGTEMTAKSAAKTAGKGASRLGGALLRVGATTFVEFIPGLNAIFFGWTIMVLWEFISDFKNFSLEAGD